MCLVWTRPFSLGWRSSCLAEGSISGRWCRADTGRSQVLFELFERRIEVVGYGALELSPRYGLLSLLGYPREPGYRLPVICNQDIFAGGHTLNQLRQAALGLMHIYDCCHAF